LTFSDNPPKIFSMNPRGKIPTREQGGPASRQLRTFLAVPLPEVMLERVARTRDELAGALPRVRWVDPAAIHLTLKFFGDVPEEFLEKIGAVMLSVGRLFAPFPIEIGRVGAFPSPSRARVIWLGVTGEPLITLQGILEERLQQTGIPREERTFSPHLTLGRSRREPLHAREILEKYRDLVCGTLQVDKMVLFESRLQPSGAVHLPLKTVFLEG
jgi:2'-5' RNA ligase